MLSPTGILGNFFLSLCSAVCKLVDCTLIESKYYNFKCVLFLPQIFMKISFNLLLCQDLNTSNIQLGHKRSIVQIVFSLTVIRNTKKLQQERQSLLF